MQKEEKLPDNIQADIDLIMETGPKELNYMQKNNWVLEPAMVIRQKKYELHQKFVSNMVKNVASFFVLAKDFTHYESVQKVLELAYEVVNLFESRYSEYLLKWDWNTYPSETGDEIDKIEAEATFQSKFLKDVQDSKNKIGKIKIDKSDGTDNIILPLQNGVILALPFISQAINRYPITKEAMKKKLDSLGIDTDAALSGEAFKTIPEKTVKVKTKVKTKANGKKRSSTSSKTNRKTNTSTVPREGGGGIS